MERAHTLLEEVVAALERLVGRLVYVRITDATVAPGTSIAAFSGILNAGDIQDTPAGIEGVSFAVGDTDTSNRPPNTFKLWRSSLTDAAFSDVGVELRIGSVVVVVDRAE